jgi:uncharacterized membrane protein
MTLLPGWNSVDAVSGIAHWLHISAIAVLALLVVAEGMALVYDSRKDSLIGAAERTVQEQRDQQEAENQRLHDEEAASLRQKLAEAQQKAEEASKQATALEAKNAPRVLSDTERRVLIDALKPFAGTKVNVVISLGDMEAKTYAGQFVEMFRAAGWDAGPSDGIAQAVYTGPPEYGIQVTVNEGEVRLGHLPPGSDSLLRTLIALGLTKGVFVNSGTPVGEIEFRVGPKKSE